MTDRFKNMRVDDLVKLMEYIIKYEAMGSDRYSVGAIKQRLNLTAEEYDELYGLCMPAIRMKNGERFFKLAYKGMKAEIQRVLGSVEKQKMDIGDALSEIKFIINQESENFINKEGVA